MLDIENPSFFKSLEKYTQANLEGIGVFHDVGTPL